MKAPIFYLLSVLLVAAALTLSIVIRFKNPDMAETRLLIDFWPSWLLVVGACVGALYFAREANRGLP